eukprot:363947-Chlamydomonas_euryale.AAC.3
MLRVLDRRHHCLAPHCNASSALGGLARVSPQNTVRGAQVRHPWLRPEKAACVRLPVFNGVYGRSGIWLERPSGRSTQLGGDD